MRKSRLLKLVLAGCISTSLIFVSFTLPYGLQNLYAAAWADGTIPRPPDDQASFLAYLKRIGQPAYSRDHRYPANFATFHDYKMLVYGTPAQVPGNRYDAVYQQYAMLGFSYEERPVTNSLFPDDAPGGITQSNPFSWKENDLGSTASSSWQRLDSAQRQQLKEVQLYYRNQPFGLMNFSTLGLSERKAIVLAPPSWHLGSALYTEHYLTRNGRRETRYATFTCNGSGNAELSCSLEILTPPDKDKAYGFAEGEDEMRISYRVTGRIEALSGLASEKDIVLRGVGTEDGVKYGSGMGPFVYEGTKVLHRSILEGATAGVAEITATTFVVSGMGDIILQEQVKYLPLRSHKPIEPLTITADIKGAIGYFSGVKTLNGRRLPLTKHRFLGLETTWLNVNFNKPVTNWKYTFLSQTHTVPAGANQVSYSIPIKMPLNHDTLTWNGKRLQPALKIEIEAADRNASSNRASAIIQGIELTGDTFDLLYLQTAN
ncbi:MAG: hypothetical protein GX749_05590 [Ruminococcaceae bacterium]|nr:hypothetical protein [Oscillospiraceae bacterium]